ncbi:MAG: hypothetical protein HWN81_16925 [Candidatus Lokiarchaeota archaeon]|nr:hypothetical protein [Candidatus Lokiarchaeota archaeon]
MHTDLKKWEGSRVVRDDPSPLTIYDVNGQPLFYEFIIKQKGEVIGKIKTAASKVLGSSVLTIEIFPSYSNREFFKKFFENIQKIPWDITQKIQSIIEKEYPGTEIKSMNLQICYDYPNIGLLITLIDPKTKVIKDKIIIDGSTLERIPIDNYNIWSMYDTIKPSDRQDKIVKWEFDNRLVQSLKQTCKINGLEFKKQGTPDGRFMQIVENELNIKNFLRTKSLNVEYDWAVPPHTRVGDVVFISLGGISDYTIPTSLYMIFRYHGIMPPNPDSIHSLFRANTQYSVNEIEEYLPIIRGKIDRTPTFEEILLEIDNERPVLKALGISDKNYINQPGSVVCGYREYDYTGIDEEGVKKTISASRSLKIFDPKLRRSHGWLQPYERWESWDLYTLTQGKPVVNVYITKPDLEPKITIARLKSMNNANDIRNYLIKNRNHLLRQIGTTRIRKKSYTGRETVEQINVLFDFVFRYLDYEEIFRYLKSIDLGVYYDDELKKGFQIGFYSDICNLILNYNHTDIARRYLEYHIYHLFPYFFEIKDRDEEVRSVLLRIKDAWLPYCRMLDKDDLKVLRRIFGTDFHEEWC